jgi:hypothetical protein
MHNNFMAQTPPLKHFFNIRNFAMSIEIIKLKQELVEIARDMTLANIQTQVNTAFNDVLQSADLRTDLQKHKLESVKATLLSEFESNADHINKVVHQPAHIVKDSSALQLQFAGLEALQDFNKTTDSNPTLRKKIKPLLKKISNLSKKNKFEETRLRLIAASNELPDKNYQALADNIKLIKEWQSDVEKYLPGYFKELRELKSLAETFEQDNRSLEEKLIPFKEFFARRWEKIRGTSSDYCFSPNSEVNKLCSQLATAIADVSPDVGRFSLLMPSVTVVKSDMTYTYFDDPNLKLEHFILNNDQTRFIEIEACLLYAEDDVIYKYTTLVNKEVTELITAEKLRVINHSAQTQNYADAIVALRNFTACEDRIPLAKPMGIIYND